jgi:hypothetical protein
MSVTDHSGFAGVSIHMRRVRPGRTAGRSASSEVASTKSTAIPQASAKFFSQLRNPQYMTRGATTWLSRGRLWNTAAAAAMPEENSNVAAPPSSAVSNACGWS